MIMAAARVTTAFADLPGRRADSSRETVAERDPDVIVLVDASWDPVAVK